MAVAAAAAAAVAVAVVVVVVAGGWILARRKKQVFCLGLSLVHAFQDCSSSRNSPNPR